MAKKPKTLYTCQQCGHQESKWLGKCPSCGQWNTFLEVTLNQQPAGAPKRPLARAQVQPLSHIEEMPGIRQTTKINELDQVLGGGLMKGSCVLLGGEPGIGKSTLMMQMAGKHPKKVLYASGEESLSQIKNRANRLQIPQDHIDLLCSSYLEDVVNVIEQEKPDLVMVDSIQTLYSPEAGQTPGSVNQLKYCAFDLIQTCKEKDISLFLVAHVTKGGNIAGPKALEHMVDTVLYFETSSSEVRMLRSSKNRFGSVDELGIFSMDATGLKEVGDPEALFLTDRGTEVPAGIAVATVYEGSRVFLVEIQALTVTAKGGLGRVYSDKVDQARVSRVAAVLEKHLGLRFSDQDIYVNVAGGMKLNETGIDFALAAALYSARTNLQVPGKTAFAGEISLAGELRPIPHLDRRKKAGENLGYKDFYMPGQKGEQSFSDIGGAFKNLFKKKN